MTEQQQQIIVESQDTMWSTIGSLVREMGAAQLPGWAFIALFLLVLIFAGMIYLIYRVKFRNGGN